MIEIVSRGDGTVPFVHRAAVETGRDANAVTVKEPDHRYSKSDCGRTMNAKSKTDAAAKSTGHPDGKNGSSLYSCANESASKAHADDKPIKPIRRHRSPAQRTPVMTHDGNPDE